MVVMEEAVVEEAAASEDVNLVELMNARARSYGMLARLFREEVDLPTLRELQKMRFPQATGNAAADEGYHQLYDYLKRAWDDSVTELAIDYVSTFIGHGVNGYSAAYPYESVYTSERRLLMQEARAEVLATLRENELKRGRGPHRAGARVHAAHGPSRRRGAVRQRRGRGDRLPAHVLRLP